MPAEVDLTDPFHPDPFAPLSDLEHIGRRRRWAIAAEDERHKGSEADERGKRCSFGQLDRASGERLECGARATWRLDVICDSCGPRVGHCCTTHRPTIETGIAEGHLRCLLDRPDDGYIVELIHAEPISR